MTTYVAPLRTFGVDIFERKANLLGLPPTPLLKQSTDLVIFGRKNAAGKADGLSFVFGKKKNAPLLWALPPSIKSIRCHTNGKRSGIWSYYSRGAMHRQVHYSEGKPIKARLFQDDGILIGEINLKEGKPHGRYFLVGLEEGNYTNNKRVGLWKFYYKNKIVETATYRNGKVDGQICIYGKITGARMARIPVKQGVAHGWAYYWAPGSNVGYFAKQKFVNGKTVRRIAENDLHENWHPKLLGIRLRSEAAELMFKQRPTSIESRKLVVDYGMKNIQRPEKRAALIRAAFKKAYKIEANYLRFYSVPDSIPSLT